MKIAARAYAKLNLTLEVLGKRPDGYHEIAGIFQTISIADELSFEPADTLSLTCDAEGLAGDDNLVLRAARLLQFRGRTTAGARIGLRKGIPVAAGLGGGSADAAVTLLALNQLWGLKLGPGFLRGMAAELGSDVPYLLHGGTARIGGRGEVVTPLAPMRPHHFVIVTPAAHVANKTAAMYGLLRPEHYTKGRVTAVLADAVQRGQALREPWQFNAFDTVAFAAHPDLHSWRADLVLAYFRRPHLCGAGPSLFMPVDSMADAEALVARLPLARSERAFPVVTAPASAEFTFDD